MKMRMVIIAACAGMFALVQTDLAQAAFAGARELMRAVKMNTGEAVQLVQNPGHCREGYVVVETTVRSGNIRRTCVLRKGSWLEYKDQRNYQGRWHGGQRGRWDDRRGSSGHRQ
jgi:hypothetical protein